MNNFIKKKAVIVKDEHGLPNYMTMFYLELLLSTEQAAGFKTPGYGLIVRLKKP